MATAAPLTEPSDLECSVCSEYFTQPKLLPCAHLICRGCLISWLDSQPQAQCPLCRFPILQPGQATPKSWDVVADGLPTDLAMAALVEAERLTKQDHQCVVCENVAATSLCLDCGDALCAFCTKAHKKLSVSRNHTVEDLSSLTTDKLSSFRPSPCPAHADKVCELYCATHDVSMCHICSASQHRSCPDVKDVQHKAEECRATLQQLADTLTAKEAVLSRALDQLDQHQLEMDKKAQVALFEMKTTCDRLKSAIDACYQRAEKQVKDKFSDVTSGVQSGKDCLLQRRGRVTSNKRTVDRTTESKKRDVVTSMTSLLEKRVSELDLSVSLPDNAKVINKLTFAVDLEVVKRLEQELWNFLGQVKVTPADLLCQKKQKKKMSPSPLDNPVRVQPPAEWRFHSNHGQNIVLTNGGKSAERQGALYSNEGIVVGCLPMQVNTLYEVRVDKKDYGYGFGWSMYTGVTDAAPDTLTLPKTSWNWTAAIVIANDRVAVKGKGTSSQMGQKLLNMSVNSRLGVLVDDKRDLHLYIDGQDQGVAAPDMPDPCYPLFELCGPYRQVTTLPIKVIRK